MLLPSYYAGSKLCWYNWLKPNDMHIYTTFNYLIIIIMTATVLVQLVQQCIVTYVHMLHILHT